MSAVAFANSRSQDVDLQYVNSWSLYSKLDMVTVLRTVNMKEILTHEVSNANDIIYLQYLQWTWEIYLHSCSIYS